MEKSQNTDFNEDTTSVACTKLYGSKSWTLRNNEETGLDAFEMKGLRKILRVSWTAKQTNEWITHSHGYSTGVTPYGGVKCRWGGSKSATFHK